MYITNSVYIINRVYNALLQGQSVLNCTGENCKEQNFILRMHVTGDDSQIGRKITFMGPNLLVLPSQMCETSEQLLLYSLNCNNCVEICCCLLQRPNQECSEVIQKLFVGERRCRFSCKLQESADGFIPCANPWHRALTPKPPAVPERLECLAHGFVRPFPASNW